MSVGGPLLILAAGALLMLGVLSGADLLLVGSVAVSLCTVVVSIAQAHVLLRRQGVTDPPPSAGQSEALR